MPTILIADDNPQIAAILQQYAHRDGYVTHIARDGEEALEFFRRDNPDVVLLDVMMPKIDGFEVCKEIRKTSNVPILMVTARGEDFEKIIGLDIGADDYIIKPFSPSEVMARIRAVVRRVEPEKGGEGSSETCTSGSVTVDIATYTTTINETTITLTKKEIELLWLLMTNEKKVFSRNDLLSALWGYDYFGDTRTVDSHVKRLRAKTDRVPHDDWEIKTVWGVGYKFEGNLQGENAGDESSGEVDD